MENLNYGYFEVGRALVPHQALNKDNSEESSGGGFRSLFVIAQAQQSMMGATVGECMERMVEVGSPN